MATKISDSLKALSRELRYEPTTKRIRARLNGALVLDTRRAVIVWEPRRVVPSYAVPVDGIVGVLSPAPPPQPAGPGASPLHTGITFSRHSAPGTSLDVSAGGHTAEDAAFRFEDTELDGYVSFNAADFDWLEEDDAVQSHPRDPFHRVDIRHSSRHIRATHGDSVLAESNAPVMVFETGMQEQPYLPPQDVNWDLLVPTDSFTLCPYKGTASYWRLASDDSPTPSDVAWSYQEPLPLAGEITGYVCFYDTLVEVVEVDGTP